MIQKTSALRRHAHNKQASAFTLVELLVVISIIALLIAILLPSLSKAREQAKFVKCLAQQKALSVGIILYGNAQNDLLPGPLHPPIFRKCGGSREDLAEGWEKLNEEMALPWFLPYKLSPYMSKYDTYLEMVDDLATCPTASKYIPDEEFQPGHTAKGETELNPNYMHPYNYVVNSWPITSPTYYFGWSNTGYSVEGWTREYKSVMAANPDYDEYTNPVGSFHRPKSTLRIKNASREWIIGDAWGGEVSNIHVVPITPILHEKSYGGTWGLGTAGLSRLPLTPYPYHQNKDTTGLLYLDGHAGSYKGDSEKWAKDFPVNRRPDYPT